MGFSKSPKVWAVITLLDIDNFSQHLDLIPHNNSFVTDIENYILVKQLNCHGSFIIMQTSSLRKEKFSLAGVQGDEVVFVLLASVVSGVGVGVAVVAIGVGMAIGQVAVGVAMVVAKVVEVVGVSSSISIGLGFRSSYSLGLSSRLSSRLSHSSSKEEESSGKLGK